MIARIKGDIVSLEEGRLLLEVGSMVYEIMVPATVETRLKEMPPAPVTLVIYDYITIDQNRGWASLVGFCDELERDFFEKFIGVSGIGPRAAVKAFAKPVADIAQAIEEGDMNFLKSLSGIGPQKAKQIVAQLQGKVGRFALLPSGTKEKHAPITHEIAQEARQVLARLGYSARESEEMIGRVSREKPDIGSLEDFLNEIYRQKKVRHE